MTGGEEPDPRRAVDGGRSCMDRERAAHDRGDHAVEDAVADLAAMIKPPHPSDTSLRWNPPQTTMRQRADRSSREEFNQGTAVRRHRLQRLAAPHRRSAPRRGKELEWYRRGSFQPKSRRMRALQTAARPSRPVPVDRPAARRSRARRRWARRRRSRCRQARHPRPIFPRT